MNKKLLTISLVAFVGVILLFAERSFSQGAAINTTGAGPDNSAALDVSSSTQGVLIPRMTEAQKQLISNPATGLMIFQTDGSSGFWYYNGSSWVQSIGLTGQAGSVGATGATGPTGLLDPGTAAGNTPYWDGNQWVVNSSNIYNNGSTVGIGTNNPDPSAGVHISFSDKGFLIPRMTTSQRNTIASPADGLQIFNTTTNCFETYIYPIWQNIFCGCTPSPAVTAGTHTATQTQITWNWSTVSGALGYKYNTVNDYASAVDNGTNSSFIQTGLTCNTPYSLYVWAYSNCGHSTVTTLTQSTPVCFTCGVNNVTFTYLGSSVTYGTVSRSGICWLDRNLGATAVATAYNHVSAYGDLFQWGRLDDGHQIRNSTTTTTMSSSDVPGHSLFISSQSAPWDWRSPSNNLLWQGVSGTNNPCPSGWRLPTMTEINNERASWSQQNYNGGIASTLKWTAAGYRVTATPSGEGSIGSIWSSTVNGTDGYYLYFSSSEAYMSGYGRMIGASVRCLKDY